MLAMYIVLENYLGMVCDYPEAYENQPGFEFIKEVPTVWDETKVLDAKVDEFIEIARRKNDQWYIGTINNHESRQIQIPLHFLSDGEYIAEIFSDAKDDSINPNHLNKQTSIVKKDATISLQLESGGGAVIILKKK
jgi:alpha-glucosidase